MKIQDLHIIYFNYTSDLLIHLISNKFSSETQHLAEFYLFELFSHMEQSIGTDESEHVENVLCAVFSHSVMSNSLQPHGL